MSTILSADLIRLSSVLFALAVVHTFLTPLFKRLSHHTNRRAFAKSLFHLLSEVEIVFGIWAIIFLMAIAASHGSEVSVQYLSGVQFAEPVFVFVIMCISASKPILQSVEQLIALAARYLPVPSYLRFYCALFFIGPLLGSLITEPAAMTVSAILALRYFSKDISTSFKYTTLALLFVNISIGGTLTHFAAPPVLMVAKAWNLSTPIMFFRYGIKAMIAMALSTGLTAYLFRFELKRVHMPVPGDNKRMVPLWVVLSHIFFMIFTVFFHNIIIVCLGIFLLFVGWVRATPHYQSALKIRESLLVGFFLAGLVTLGQPQDWWLVPLLTKLTETQLYIGAILLTGITDNAALTYLGSLVSNLADQSRYLLLAGAVAGGGLTVIANAPNPAGYGILAPAFGDVGVQPLRLFLHALPFTIIASLAFYFL